MDRIDPGSLSAPDLVTLLSYYRFSFQRDEFRSFICVVFLVFLTAGLALLI